MQRNSEVYQSDLNNAETAVRQYFDAKSPATQSWLKELAELKALDVRMTADDGLKNSLNAIRTYRDGMGAAACMLPVKTNCCTARLSMVSVSSTSQSTRPLVNSR